MIRLELPYPISANKYWHPVVIKHGAWAEKNQHITIVPTKDAKAYKSEVAWKARSAGVRQPLAGPIEVTVLLYPHLPKDWAKRVRDDPLWWDLTVQCIDLDNANKVLWDALKGIAFTDDNLIRKSQAEIALPDGAARVVVTIKPYERPHPQEALFAREPVYVPKKAEPKPERKAKERAQQPAALSSLPEGKDPF